VGGKWACGGGHTGKFNNIMLLENRVKKFDNQKKFLIDHVRF